MGIFDGLKRKLRKNKETETPERTKDAITTSTEKPKPEKTGITKQPSVPKRLSPPKPQASARVEKAKILEGYRVKDASAHKLRWQDESSRKAEVRLKEKGIQLPWHYNDTFGEDFKVLALAYLKFPKGEFGQSAEGTKPDTLCYTMGWQSYFTSCF